MSKVKVGDWIEVTRTGYNDVMCGVLKGNAYRVEALGREGEVKVQLEDKSVWWFTKNRFKKVKPPVESITVGDWIEVVEPNDRHSHVGIKAGDRYKVSSLDGDDGVLVKREDCSFFVSIHYGRIKKVEPLPVQTKELYTPLEHGGAKTERVASGHYQNANNNDVWQFVDDNLCPERVKGFYQTNAIKYVTRYHIKHDTAEKRIEDLEKVKVYIDKLIELERLG